MNFISLFIIFIYTSFNLIASENNSSEYPYIQPVSVEISQKIIRLDSDADGVYDEDDRCMDTPLGAEVDERGCLITIQADSDGDGVFDIRDNCPDTSPEFSVKKDGCPHGTTLDLTFEPDVSKVSRDQLHVLEKFADFLKEHPDYEVIIYGYSDTTGNKDKSQLLSQERANDVKEELMKLGIKITRITSVGRGSDYAIADNSTEDGRAKNRRIEIELFY